MNKKAETKSDTWQLRVFAVIDGENRGIGLDACDPIADQFKRVTISGVSRNGAGTPERYAQRCAIALERKLVEEGLKIPDARRRIAKLIEGKW